MPVWHASISLWPSPQRPSPLDRWGGRLERKARLRLDALLLGVGAGPVLCNRGGIALHLRRRLSPAELARLSPAWLAIPATDPA